MRISLSSTSTSRAQILPGFVLWCGGKSVPGPEDGSGRRTIRKRPAVGKGGKEAHERSRIVREAAAGVARFGVGGADAAGVWRPVHRRFTGDPAGAHHGGPG